MTDAQVAAPSQVADSTTPPRRALKILILEGEGAMNNLPLGIYAPLVVEVRDENDKPVEGALVTFQLPASGPGGFFPGQQLTKVVKTTLQGQASAAGFVSNKKTGRFTIRVKATIGDRFGEADVIQTNALRLTSDNLEPKKGWRRLLSWKVAIIAGVTTAVVVTIVLVTRGGSKQTITITPGPVTIGGR